MFEVIFTLDSQVNFILKNQFLIFCKQIEKHYQNRENYLGYYRHESIETWVSYNWYSQKRNKGMKIRLQALDSSSKNCKILCKIIFLNI